ncbi:MAG TPA: non-ribosomal peptide synthetase, partial [Clostridia bacterium]|nr:non-ribosomal peptide synthetase [Clostridia bacterium]
TPSLAAMLVRDEEARQALRSLRQLLLGGEALSPELVHQLDVPAEILNMYGPTETTVWSTTCHVDRKATRIWIGRPLANTEVYILDAYLQPVPIGVPGELFIGGEGVARGYLRRDQLTAEKFIPHPFKAGGGSRLYKTGDQARYLADGTIEFLGRLDHQIKLRGFRIELGEIESIVREQPGVQDCVVIAREVAPHDFRLVAYVVPAAKPAPAVSSFRERLKQKLPDYMVPSAFMLLDKLPLTPNGKLNRRALPAPESRIQPETPAMPPRSLTEKKLAEIWCNVLGRKAIGIHDNFFEQGGHSLLATQVVSQVRTALDKSFSIVQLFRHPTIYALAQFLSHQSVSGPLVKRDSPRVRPRKQFRWPRREAPAEPLAQPVDCPQPCININNRSTHPTPSASNAALTARAAGGGLEELPNVTQETHDTRKHQPNV